MMHVLPHELSEGGDATGRNGWFEFNPRERQQQEIVIKSSKVFPGSARDEIWPQDGIC